MRHDHGWHLFYTGNHRDEDWKRSSYTCLVELMDDGKQELSVDRSGMERRFNTQQGEVRTHPLSKGLHHLRIYTDKSSVEVFVNDGDAALHLWKRKPSVQDNFVV